MTTHRRTCFSWSWGARDALTLGGWQRIYVSSWEFLILFGASIWTIAAFAEKPTMPVIGFVNAASPQGYARPFSAFLKGLGETGYVEGRNVAMEYRWAEGHIDRLPAMVADLSKSDNPATLPVQ